MIQSSDFKLNQWYRFKDEKHMYAFLNNNPSYGRFVSTVELEPFRFVQFLQTIRHFKDPNILVDIMVVESKVNLVSRDDAITAVENRMFNYIEVCNG